jgi:Na+/proline symporter
MFNLDICIFFAFLALNLGVGLWYGRGVSTIRQYATGNKRFSTIVIALTIVATWASGSGLITWSIYQKGWLGIIARVQNALVFGL